MVRRRTQSKKKASHYFTREEVQAHTDKIFSTSPYKGKKSRKTKVHNEIEKVRQEANRTKCPLTYPTAKVNELVLLLQTLICSLIIIIIIIL